MRQINKILNGLTLLVIVGFIAVLTVVMVGIAVLNRDADFARQTYSVEEVVSNPLAFHNSQVCLRGYYQTKWQVSELGKTFLGDAIVETDGTMERERVWVNVAVPQDTLACTTADSIETCAGITTACGKFIMDERGVGYQNHYLFGLY